MADCLGISLGKERLAVAVVSRSGRGRRVESFQHFAYEEEHPDISRRAAFAAAKASAYAAMPVALSLPGEDVFLQPHTVPFAKRAHIARTLPFEMEDKLPFEADTAVLDFAVLGREAAKSRILVAAAPRELVQAAVDPFTAAGVKVRLVTTDVLSTPALGELLGEDAYTILDVSSSGWKLSLCEKGRLVFARAAPAAPAPAGLERALAGWFRQSFMAAPAQLSGSRVFVCGTGAESLDCEALSKELSVPVERLVFPESSLADSAGAEGAQTAFLASAAISAAMTLSAGTGEIDLLRAARGRERILETLLAPLGAALVLVALFYAVQALRFSGERARSAAAARSTQAEARKIWDALFPDEEPAGGVHESLAAKVNEVESNRGRQVLGNDVAWFLKALSVLSGSVPEGARPTFTEFDAKPDTLTIKVSSNESASAEQIAKAVTAGGLFTAEYRELKTDAQGRTTYQIVMKPVGGTDGR